MSGTFPSSPGFRAVNLRSRKYNYRSESVSGRVQVRALGSQRWAFTAVFPPMTRSEFAPVLAFLENQDGMLETFQIVITELSTSSGSASGTAAANGAATTGATSMNVDGFTGSLKAGDFIKFASHSKVYMLTADRSGAGSMTFKPALVEDVADNEVITYTDVPFTVRTENDVQEYSVDTAVHLNFEIDLVEAL